MTAAIAAAPTQLIFEEFKLRLVSEVQRSATKAIAVAPTSCSELSDRLIDEKRRISQKAQQDELVMPKFAKFMQERALLFSRDSTLLLLADPQASDALLYLFTAHHSPTQY
jgi:hypothetical protein